MQHQNLLESSEIDFWNFKMYCTNNVNYKDNLVLDCKASYLVLEDVYNNLKPSKDSIVENFKILSKHIDQNDEKSLLVEKSKLILKSLAKMSSWKSQLKVFEDSLNQTGLYTWVKNMSECNSPKLFLEAWKVLNNLQLNQDITFSDGIYTFEPPDCPTENPLLDVVLVHGIQGGAAWTWRQDDSMNHLPILSQNLRKIILRDHSSDSTGNFIRNNYSWMWPLDWLKPRAKKNIRIIAVNYAASWWNWSQNPPPSRSIDSLGKEFVHKLKAAGVGSRPILWISHSMGGILVKKMLEVENNLQTSARNNLLSSTKAVVFLSVPHFGSPLATWSCLASFILRPSQFLYELKAGSKELLKLNESFTLDCQNHSIKVLTLNENLPCRITKNAPLMTFVPHEYGDPHIGDYQAIDVTHLGICKPKDVSDPLYQVIEEFTNQIIEEL